MPTSLIRLAISAALLLLSLVAAPVPPAAAQATPVDGAADFRTAPFVGPGTYRDEIVTGETVWYSVVYTNHTPLYITASLVGVDPATTPELTLVRVVTGATLNELYAKPEDIDGRTGETTGGAETNVWFIAFRLNTTGQLGIRYELEFTVDGVGSANLAPCGPDCTLDDDLTSLQADIAGLDSAVQTLQQEIGSLGAPLPSDDPPELVELEAEQADLQQRVDTEQAAISELCGGEQCDELPSTSSTPWILVGILTAAALVASGGLIRTVRRHAATVRKGAA